MDSSLPLDHPEKITEMVENNLKIPRPKGMLYYAEWMQPALNLLEKYPHDVVLECLYNLAVSLAFDLKDKSTHAPAIKAAKG